MNSEDYCSRLFDSLAREVVIKVTKPPPYVSNLLINNQEDPVILVYKEIKPNENTHINEISGAKINSVVDSIADLSLTGQPLESPFVEDDDDILNFTAVVEPKCVSEENCHGPLTLLEARRCTSIVFLKMAPPLPVWILTDMSDRSKTFLMGAEIKSNWRTRKWAIAHAHQTEKIPIKDMSDDFEKMFNIELVCKRSSAVSCLFNISDQPGMAKNAKFFLEVKWQTPSYEVPLTQADTTLILECIVGQEESQISRWWQQLNLLHDYLEIIKERRQNQQAVLTYQRNTIKLPFFKTDSNKLPLIDRVRNLLQRSDSMSVCRQLATHQNTTSVLNSTIHELLTEKQKGHDFTDRLWSLLIEAETYQELVECFHLVIKEVRQQPIKPYIFVKNKTRMASLLRNLKTSSSDMELLLVEPLELVVEMGIDKLKRDYMFMFLASHISNEESLSLPKLPSFSEVGNSEWHASVDTWLQCLAQLHTVLELVSVIHATLSTPLLVQVTSLALSTYVCKDSPVKSLSHLINNRSYRLQAPVASKEVESFIVGSKPFHKWILQLSASTDKHCMTSTYVLLENSPLPENLLMQLIEDDTLHNSSDILTETVIQGSIKGEEKYSYFQLCTISDQMPY